MRVECVFFSTCMFGWLMIFSDPQTLQESLFGYSMPHLCPKCVMSLTRNSGLPDHEKEAWQGPHRWNHEKNNRVKFVSVCNDFTTWYTWMFFSFLVAMITNEFSLW